MKNPVQMIPKPGHEVDHPNRDHFPLKMNVAEKLHFRRNRFDIE